jgi:hypothetical protein
MRAEKAYLSNYPVPVLLFPDMATGNPQNKRET